MPTKAFIDGNTAAAYGVKLAKPDVICAYPITPQTPIVEALAGFVANGLLKSKYIPIEGEHSAIIACAAAATAGARTFTATSSQGLAYMHEGLFYTSGSRLPVVMAVVSRSIGVPWTILTGHDDSIAQRDTGWIQIYCRNNQEILDTVIQAYRIAEDHRVMLPVMVCFEGYVLSHCYENVVIPDQEEVDSFLPSFKPIYKLDVEDPLILTTFVPADWWAGFKRKHDEAMEQAKRVIAEVDREYRTRFGRGYGGLIEEYLCDDAEAILIAMGSITETAKMVINRLRKQGEKVGLLNLRAFRPFPKEELRRVAVNVRAIGVIERDYSVGQGGAVFVELRSTLYDLDQRPSVLSFITGLGGRDVTPSDIERIAIKTLKAARTGRVETEVEWSFGGRF
ncbi:MAG: transketolase C-terminal domain-containing protein [Candidatus Nezhaarchaeales archaeon]